jgi:NhaP-type Na+/H+ or K+/H+ antiporter
MFLGIAFIAIGAVAAIITRYAVHMRAKDDVWWNLLRFTILGLGALLFGVSLGFGVGIFTRKSNSLPK